MKLLSLEIQGFKSFPDKTEFRFGDGITAVVGPNGSGKSNIADAVRWVLGEQSTKTLRGNKMEDVIFGGTQARKAVGFASVQLTIDNADGSLGLEAGVITISRRLYRSGESEYRLNNAAVRLKDVHEMLMDTGLGRDGYSIIGQGRIAEIVSSKSKERREIFEEASGISRFRYRKEEAQRKLEQAEENLLRLRDIQAELESRVGPLKEQSEKAQKFLTYATEKKQLEISLWVDSLAQLKQQLSAQEEKVFLCKNQYEETQRRIDGIEAEIARLYEKTQGLAVQMDVAREQRRECEEELAKGEADIAVRRNDIHHNQQSVARIAAELETAGTGSSETEEKLRQQEDAFAQRELALAELQQTLAQQEAQLLEKRTAHTGLQQAGNALSVRIESLDKTSAQAQLQKATSASLIEDVSVRLGALEQGDTGKDSVLEQLEQAMEECRKQQAQVQENENSLHNSQKGYALKLQGKQAALAELGQKAAQLDSGIAERKQRAKLLDDLETSLEGFAGSVKYLLTQVKKGALSGIFGAVSSLIQTKPEYAVAIETALGGAMQNLVVRDESAAKQGIRALKDARAGRATFLPITSVKGRVLTGHGLERYEGFVALGCQLVEFDSRFEGIIQQLLGRVVVVEDLDSGTQIAKATGYKYRFVTLDGQLINAGGSFTGGSVAKSSGSLSRRHQIQELEAEAQKLTQQRTQLEDELRESREEISALEAAAQGLAGELQTLQEDKMRLAYQQKQLEAEARQAQQNRQLAKDELKRLMHRLEELKQTSRSSQNSLAELAAQRDELEQQRTQNTSEAAELSAQLQALSSEVEKHRFELLTVQKDQELCQQTLEQLRLQRDSAGQTQQRLQQEHQQLLLQNTEIEAHILQVQQQNQQRRQTIEQLGQQIEQWNKDRLEIEGQTTQQRSKERDVSGEKEQVSRELARLEERRINLQGEYDSIIARLWDEYELTRTQATELAVPLEDRSRSQHSLTELKARIKALGHVNVAAIEEYKEVSERYEFLTAQLEDIERSRTQLQTLILELTQEMRTLFTESFHRISEHFSRIFVQLFGGGKASLALTNSDDVLESGVEIYVQPPGKIIKNLTLLSGGEQSFVAIAIYFAILKVRPAPFCLLDEIEAALDDVNVVKFASYLRQMSGNTQFIAITHRRGTMEEADVLYGVTMEEEGVSKILELKVGEVEKRLGIS